MNSTTIPNRLGSRPACAVVFTMALMAILFLPATGGGQSFKGLEGLPRELADAIACSADGSVVVGWSFTNGGQQHAFRWMSGDGMLDLGTLGGNYSEADVISADGLVIAGISTTSNGEYHAFRWTSTGGMIDLGTLGGDYSESDAISADGSVVAGISATSSGDQHAFRWSAADGMVDLGTVGGLQSGASGTSGDGSVVVGYSLDSTGQQRAFRWTLTEGMVDLSVVGVMTGGAAAVSADGSTVAGWYTTIGGNGTDYRAFRWTASGGLEDLGISPGTGGTGANDYYVSADGSVVVGFSRPHAFRWTVGTGLSDLGDLGGGWSHARGVSADGSAIAGWSITTSGRTHPFRWTASEGLVDLGTVGSRSATPWAISADGSTVVGNIVTTSSQQHAFRWTTAGLVDLGVLGSIPNASYVFALASDGSEAAGHGLTTVGGSPRALRWSAGVGPVDLGTLGGNESSAAAISADGSVVVGRSQNIDYATHAFRWAASGGSQDLGTLGEGLCELGVSHGYSLAYQVSADGLVVVGTSSAPNTCNHAFRWTAAGGMTDLGTLGGGESFAQAVSPDGSVVMGYSDTPAGQQHAFRWTADGGMIDLGTLGGTSSSGSGISADGSVIVGSAGTADGHQHAFRWTESGGMVDLGTLGGDDSNASAVSADGSVLSGSASTTGGQSHAFCWTQSLGMIDLGTLGGAASAAGLVSADGSAIAGWSELSNGQHHAFRWTQAGGMRSIQNDLGLVTAGWSLSNVAAMSSDGLVIAGNGTSPTGTDQAWIADFSWPLPRITAQPHSQTTTLGSTVSFFVGVSSPTNPSFQWRKDGVDISGATSATLTLSAVQFADAGEYSVVVANAQGSASSAPATLTVTQRPAVRWIQPGGGNWSNAVNWDTGVVPGPGDDVFITLDGTYTVTLDANSTAASLTVGGNNGTQTLVVPGATLTLANASAFTANGILELSGGNLNGAGALTLAGPVNWTGGAFTGNGQTIFGAASVVSVSGAADKFVFTRTVINRGVMTVGNALNVWVDYGGVLVNEGLLDLQNDQVMPFFGSGGGTFNNSGTLRKSGTGAVPFGGVVVNNSGNVQVLAGALELNGGGNSSGAFTVAAGTMLSFSGTHTMSDTASISGAGLVNFYGSTFALAGLYNVTGATALTYGTVELNGPVTSLGGQLSLAGTLVLNQDVVHEGSLDLLPNGQQSGSGSLTVNGPVNWAGGAFTGNGQTIFGAASVVSVSGAADKFVFTRTVINRGVMTVGNALNVWVDYGGVLVNEGLLDLQNDQVMPFFGSGGGTFNNSGTLRKSGTGAVPLGGVVVNNSGTIQVDHGQIIFSAYSQTDGVLDLGISAADDYGRIGFSGPLAMTGVLKTHWNGTYVANAGEVFTLLTYPSKSNAFDTLDLAPGTAWTVSNGDTAVIITAASVPQAPVILTQPQSRAAVAGESITFSVAATGNPAPIYQWRKDGADISGAQSASLTLNNVQTTDAGSYDVVVSNSEGSIPSDAATLTVSAAPDQVLYVSNNGDNTVHRFGVDGSDLGVFIDSGLSSPSGLAFDQQGNLYVANLGTDTIKEFSPAGVEIATFASAGLDDPQMIAFDADGNLYAANYYSGAIRKFDPTGADLGVFSSPGQVALAFDRDGNLFATSNAGSIHKFNPSGTDLGVFASATYPTGLAFDQNGDLWVADQGANSLTRFNPAGQGTVISSPGLSAPTGLAFDAAGNLYVANLIGNTIQKFDANGTDLGIFASGLGHPAFLAFGPAAAHAPPSITQQPQSQNVAAGSSVTFMVVATGIPAPTYQWRNGGSPIPGANSPVFTLNNVQSSDGGSYDVVVSNPQGSVLSDPTTLTVDSLPTITIVYNVALAVNGSTTATFTVGDAETAPGSLTVEATTSNPALLPYLVAQPGATEAERLLPIVPAAGLFGTAAVTLTVSDGLASATTSFLVTVVPVATITGLSPASGAANDSSDLTLIVNGIGFASGAVVNWNGGALATTFVDESTLAAVIPASNLVSASDVVTALVTVVNPPAGESVPAAFAIVGSAVAAVQSNVAPPGESAEVSTAPTNGTSAGVAALLDNSGGTDPVTVSAATYSGNPVSGTVVDVGGGYVDLRVEGAPATAIMVADFYYPRAITGQTEADLVLLFFNGTAWSPVLGSGGALPLKDTTDDLDSTTSGGRFRVIFDSSSTPMLAELTGTVFTPTRAELPSITTGPQDATAQVGANATFSVSATGTGPFSYQWFKGEMEIDGAIASTLTLHNVRMAEAGSYKVKVSNIVGDVTSAAATLTVTRLRPVVNWSAPTDIVYGVALGATQLNAAANVPGAYSYSPAAGTVLSAGLGQELSVVFTPTDTVNYEPISKSVTIRVLPAPLTITALDATKVYGAGLPAFGATYAGFVNGDTAASLSTPVVFATTGSASSPAGNYPITPSGATSPNYTISFVTATLAVTRASLTITALDATKVYGAALPAFSATYAGFVNGDTAASLSTPVVLSTTASASSPAGSYPITPNGATSPNYDISFVNATLAVTRASLTITALDATKVYGAALPAFAARYDGFVNGDTAASLSTPVVFTTPGSASSPAGSYPITPNGATSPNYTISFVNGALTVTKAPLTVTANNKTRVYGQANPTWTVTYAGFVNGDTASVLQGAPSMTTTATSGSSVGAYPITTTQGTLSGSNYAFTFVNGTLTVTKAPLTVTADNKTKVYGQANPSLTVTYSGFVNGDTASVLQGAPSMTTTATSGSSVGAYPITATQGTLSASNYAFTFGSGTLTVTKAPLTVAADNKTKVYGQANPSLTVTYSGFVNGDTAGVLQGTPSAATTAATGSSVGTYPITVTQGNLKASNYSFTFANGSMTITKAGTSVTPATVSAKRGAANVTLTAAVAAVSPSTATVNEGVVSFVVRNSSGAAAGPAVSGAVSKGSASASFPSGGLAIGTYSITVTYADNIALPNWNSSTGALVGTLTIK